MSATGAGPAGDPRALAGPGQSAAAADGEVLLKVRDLVQEFVLRDYGGAKGGVLQAVSGVSFDLHAGETLGIVGETGSGKSTLARAVIQAPPPKHGQVIFEGTDLTRLSRRAMKAVRRNMQMVFQDPFTSLDPRWTVSRIVEEPLIAYATGGRQERRDRVASLLDLVGLDPARYGGRRPHELSGGQCQRVAVARALALEPKLILCDEPVSSLDVLVQAQVLNLFEKLRAELGLSYLFIAHDLALVKQVSDRVAVMYLGRLCEVGPVRDLYNEPLHPYTLALLTSIPSPDPAAGRRDTASVISGELPSPLDPPSGCRFRTRCPRARERCAAEVPELRPLADGHLVACHFPLSGDWQAAAGGQPGTVSAPAAASNVTSGDSTP
ncbi:MAG TPA: oligopeptide/dipeptide ABC transporter ATP-binding protein [Streptosporangiaceae bacterium]|nr:oligopeptide/dipeptide ABC transporter ATP-binding protein [Streptosporangiaceae bacterium]